MTRYSQKRILIYSHDAYGLGNIRRMLSICNQITLSNPNASIMLLTGSPMIHSMRIPQNVDYVKLPCITRESTEKFSATYWRNIDVDKMIRIRSDLILSAARSFRPDLIIVDKKPLGVKRELLPTLRFVRSQLPRTKLVLGLRDILDDPKVTIPIWQSHDYYGMIEKYYDQVWIFGSPELFDAAEAYQMPEGVMRKVIYTGYLFKPALLEKNQIVDDLFPDMTKPMALIMVGGGGDGFPVISAYINGIKNGQQKSACNSLIVTGPEMPAVRREWIQKATDKIDTIQVLEYTKNIENYIAAADAVVCMGGYNTTCEVLAYGKKALIIPRVEPVSEQLIRARQLQNLGMIEMLHPADLTPENIIDAVERTFNRPENNSKLAHRLNLNGLQNIGNMTREMLYPNRYTIKPFRCEMNGVYA